jgi:hypothetical protein
MKKIISFFIVVLILLAGITAWLLLGSGTAFAEKINSLLLPRMKLHQLK